jgi:alkylation response protein AidB-like acyl-CoA dehydrogenase
MSLAITEDHQLLAETARAVLERAGGTAPAREALESGGRKLPAAWDEIVGLGWLGLHVGEDVGGSGYGLPELAVVAYELGRNVFPGPFLPTSWATATIEQCGSAEQRRRWLPDLIDGRRHAAVGIEGRFIETDATVSGEAQAVLGAGWADLLLLAVGPDLLVVEATTEGVEIVAAEDSIDPSEPVAVVRLTGVRPADRLRGAVAAAIDLGRLLAAADAAGGAGACVDRATAYAKEREQFGRPIGSFQAVKHHLANMFTDAEMLSAAAWDAARATPEGGQQTLAAAVAAAYGLDCYLRCAKKSVQVHGGIGFTWEHDAHLYVRRASARRAVFAEGADPAELQVVELSRAGVRRHAEIELPPEAELVRSEVRELRDRLSAMSDEEQRRELVKTGYLVPHWPTPWGRAAGPVEQLVIDEELLEIARPNLGISGWVTLTIAQNATPDQLDRWVRPSLAGDLQFCQLFSEPGAGSDAAAIRTQGKRVEGGWLVNGQKVWTSGALDCNRGFATVRTDPSAAKHQGVTMMVVDLEGPGIDIRPIKQITGEAHFNEVFFTDVFVPDDDVVGPVNGGWKVARATLGNERVSIGGGPAFSAPAVDLVERVPEGSRWASELGVLIAESQLLQSVVLRTVTRAVVGAEPGPEGNVTKLLVGEHAQRVTDLAFRVAGPLGLSGVMGVAAGEYLRSLCLTIAGGTSEIIRNQIAERILGLPREPNLR